jgi:holin-like protein
LIAVPAMNRAKASLLTALQHVAPPRGWPQIGLLTAIWWLSDLLARRTGLPIPGGALGMILLLGALLSGLVRTSWLQQGSDSLLNHLLLFFIPAMMAPLDHREVLGVTGMKMLAVILVGTLTVMATTAATVEVCYRWRLRRDARLD